MQIIQSILFIAISVWVLLSILLYIFQPNFIYFPTSELIATPKDIGLSYEEVFIPTTDDHKINGWFIPHPSPRATLLFLHGNGGNISHRLEKILIFHQLEMNILIIDYRGYGLSSGSSSEHGTYLDAEAAINYLIKEKTIINDSIIVFGESLGAAIASWLVNSYPTGALIIDSGFTSIEAIAKHYYPYLPVKLLTRIKYPTLQRVSSINRPILVIHSVEDEIIPFSHGVELYQGANGPKTLLEISGDHNSGFYTSRQMYQNGISKFLDEWFQH